MLSSKYKMVKMLGKSSRLLIDEADLPGAAVAVPGWGAQAGGLFRPSLTTGLCPSQHSPCLAMPSMGLRFPGLALQLGDVERKSRLGHMCADGDGG